MGVELERAPKIGNAPLSSFGPNNLILTGANTQHHVARFAGPIAIKAVSYGEVEWRLQGQRYLIRPDTLLLLPEGDEYSMTIDSPEPSRTFCPVFRRGLVEDCSRVSQSTNEHLLEAPGETTSLGFRRRLVSRSGALGRALDALAAAVVAQEPSDQLSWLFEALGASAAEAISEGRRETSQLSALRLSTRVEIHRRLNVAREAVEENLAAPWTLVEMAREATMAPHHFHHCFREAYREAPRAWLSRRRAERAMALLRTTSKPVTDICFAVGYASVGSFSSSFARRFGIAPSRIQRGRGGSAWQSTVSMTLSSNGTIRRVHQLRGCDGVPKI
jgi:AraC family transcriptional regulator